MPEPTASQKFSASLKMKNRELAGLYLTELVCEGRLSDSRVATALGRMETRFGLAAAAEQALLLNNYTFMESRKEQILAETGNGLARRVILEMVEFPYGSHQNTSARAALLNQLQAAWTPERINADPAEAALTAATIIPHYYQDTTGIHNPVPLFDVALNAMNRKEGIVAAVALMESCLEIPRYGKHSLVRTATSFLGQHITAYAAASSGQTAFKKLDILRGHADQAELEQATRTLIGTMTPRDVLHLFRRHFDSPCEHQTVLLESRKKALTDYTSAVQSGTMNGGKALLEVASLFKERPEETRLFRTATLDGYLAILQVMPDKELATELAVRHMTGDSPLFRESECPRIAEVVATLLPDHPSTNDPQHQLDTLKKLQPLLPENMTATAADTVFSTRLTNVLNALAHQNPLAVVTEALRIGQIAHGRGYSKTIQATGTAITTAIPLLAEKVGPANALAMLLKNRPYSESRPDQPAVDVLKVFSSTLKTLEQQVFPPALQPPVAA